MQGGDQGLKWASKDTVDAAVGAGQAHVFRHHVGEECEADVQCIITLTYCL